MSVIHPETVQIFSLDQSDGPTQHTDIHRAASMSETP